MKKLITLALLVILLACQKEDVTRANRSQQTEKLAVTVDFYTNPHTLSASVSQYDSVNGQQVLIGTESFTITPSTQLSRNYCYTNFDYTGRIKIVVNDSIGTTPYTKWITLTNASGVLINNDTSTAKSGWVGLCKIMDAVPKHY